MSPAQAPPRGGGAAAAGPDRRSNGTLGHAALISAAMTRAAWDGSVVACRLNATGIALPSRLKQAAAAARAVLRGALDLALPPLCAACREPVDGKGLCPACWSKLSFITRPYCERLGIPFVYDPGPGILSMAAIADPPSL